jgi:DNA-binding XRE family transcriptional regulator
MSHVNGARAGKFGKAFRAARHAVRLTKAEAAEKAGVALSGLHSIENGGRGDTFWETGEHLITSLGLPLEMFFGREVIEDAARRLLMADGDPARDVLRARGLADVLRAVPDPRKHAFNDPSSASMIAQACCAALCGATNYSAVERWGREQPNEFLEGLGYGGKSPLKTSFRELFRALDPEAVRAAVSAWVEAVAPGMIPEARLLEGGDGEAAPGKPPAFLAVLGLMRDLDARLGGRVNTGGPDAVRRRLAGPVFLGTPFRTRKAPKKPPGPSH